jgi:polyisoprenoid-binding protein YceI
VGRRHRPDGGLETASRPATGRSFTTGKRTAQAIPAKARPCEAERMTNEALPAPGTYALDPERTTIRCDCKAMFGLMTVHGTFQLNSAEVSIGADPAQSTVQASVAAGSFNSGMGTRDADVVSATLLDAKAYPEITFTGAGVRQEGANWVLTGSVTAHGTTQPAEVRVTDAHMEDGTARFRATTRLDRTSFGITKKKAMVGRTVDLVIDAVGRPA